MEILQWNVLNLWPFDPVFLWFPYGPYVSVVHAIFSLGLSSPSGVQRCLQGMWAQRKARLVDFMLGMFELLADIMKAQHKGPSQQAQAQVSSSSTTSLPCIQFLSGNCLSQFFLSLLRSSNKITHFNDSPSASNSDKFWWPPFELKRWSTVKSLRWLNS